MIDRTPSPLIPPDSAGRDIYNNNSLVFSLSLEGRGTQGEGERSHL